MDWTYLLTSFEGRINRAKFWAGVVVLTAIVVVAVLIDIMAGTLYDVGNGQAIGLFSTIAMIAQIYSALAIYAKRWHDRDKSGWWTLIVLVPIIGGLWLLIELGFLRGTSGGNRFGSDPLGY